MIDERRQRGEDSKAEKGEVDEESTQQSRSTREFSPMVTWG
jgi:hypothetical protein